jgi:hypothetical protein
MSEYLHAVREQVDARVVSAHALVLLFRAAEEAEQGRDVDELEETLDLAKRVARLADDTLQGEAERLIALCEERLRRTQGPSAAGAAPVEELTTCPGCGRELAESAVRCRACGTLLV